MSTPTRAPYSPLQLVAEWLPRSCAELRHRKDPRSKFEFRAVARHQLVVAYPEFALEAQQNEWGLTGRQQRSRAGSVDYMLAPGNSSIYFSMVILLGADASNWDRPESAISSSPSHARSPLRLK